MKEIIKQNIFVYTRDTHRDYDWIYKPSLLEYNKILKVMHETYQMLRKSEEFISEWYSLDIKGSTNKIVYRIVVDGRTDGYGRIIRRYEGSVLPDITPENILILEKDLLEIQKETNNYNYGFKNLLQDKKNKNEEENSKIEECIIEFKNDQIVIKSDILAQFLQEHSNADLLTFLQVEPKNIEKIKK